MAKCPLVKRHMWCVTLQYERKSWLYEIVMQQSAHSQSCNSPRALFNNLTWAVGSKIALYRHVFLLSLWCSLEIRPDHPCWHCVLALHEMHTIMQIELEVIKPCSSLKTPTLPVLFFPPSLRSCAHGLWKRHAQFWMAVTLV